MAHFTAFAGLTELDPGDPIAVNGATFTNEDPGVVDFYLRIGAVTHRHDAHPALPNPTGTPTIAADQSGGQIAAQTQVFAAYTILDPDGGETLRSTAALVTTGVQASEPTDAPTATFDSTGGSLPVGQYAYALTLNDSGGGESTIGPAVFVQRQPGFASGQVQLAGLASGVDGTQWVSWNLWRAQDGGDFQIIATGQSDTFTDTGLICTDASRTPPLDMSNVGATNSISVTLPTAAQDPSIAGVAGGPSGVSMNLYLSLDGTFTNPCLYGNYPVASGGQAIDIAQLTLRNGAPPPVSRSLPGAQKIDPDTELLDFPWKRPVPTTAALPSGGNTDGDTRIAADTKVLWTWDEPTSTWKPIQGSGGSGGGSMLITDDTNNVSAPDTLEFVGAGSTVVAVSNPSPGRARITVTGASGGGGTGGSGNPGPTGGQPGGTMIGNYNGPEEFNYPDNTPFSLLDPPGEWGTPGFDTGGALYVLGSAAVASGGGFQTAYWASQQPADMQVQAVVSGCQAGTTAMGLWNRMDAAVMRGYLLQVQAGVATLYVANGGLTPLGTTFTVANGDTIMLRCQGTTISAFRNGVQQTSVTDTTWNGLGAQIGVRGFNDGTNYGSLDTLWARDMNGTQVGPVMWGDPVATISNLPAVGGVYADGALVMVEATGDIYQWSALASLWTLLTVGSHGGSGPGSLWGPLVTADFTNNTAKQTSFQDEATYFSVDGNTGHILVMLDSGNPVTDLSATRMAGIPDVFEGSPTDFTPSLANAGNRYIGQSNAAQNYHLPPFSSIPWPVGTVFTIVQYGTGQITVVADTGVTLRVPSGHTAATRTQYSTIELLLINRDEWVISGDLA